MPTALDAPTDKDVVITVVGASAGLAGLVLVFLGIAIAALQAFPADTPANALTAYKRTVKAVLAVFVASLIPVAVGTGWLVSGGPGWLYGWAIGLFAAQLVLVVGAATYSTYSAIKG